MVWFHQRFQGLKKNKHYFFLCFESQYCIFLSNSSICILPISNIWTKIVCFILSDVNLPDATSDLNEGLKLNTRLLANKKKLTVNIVMKKSSFTTYRYEWIIIKILFHSHSLSTICVVFTEGKFLGNIWEIFMKYFNKIFCQ